MWRIHQVGAAVTDFDATEAFYRDQLGARFLARFEPPGLLFFDFAGVRILFEKGNHPVPIYFRVDEIEREYERLLNAGIEFVEEPAMIYRDDEGKFGDPGNEEWMAFFNDPGGNTLALATQKLSSSE